MMKLASLARRLARMVQHPAVADVSKALWSFASPSQVFLDSLPGLRGVPFGDLALRFDDGLVLGFLNRRTGRCDIVPPASTLVRASPAALCRAPVHRLLHARLGRQPLPLHPWYGEFSMAHVTCCSVLAQCMH